MYSRIPVPRVDWKEKPHDMPCTFPMIGLSSEQLCIWQVGCWIRRLYGLFRGAVFTLIPIIITGGIHMDGFMDTMDAPESWGDQGKVGDSERILMRVHCYWAWAVI